MREVNIRVSNREKLRGNLFQISSSESSRVEISMSLSVDECVLQLGPSHFFLKSMLRTFIFFLRQVIINLFEHCVLQLFSHF